MTSLSSLPTIIGFCLFTLSELLPFLPINTNGIVQTFVNGFKSSFGNLDLDIVIAQKFLNGDKGRQLASLTNIIATNPEINTCIANIISNQAVIPHVNTLVNSSELQTLMYSFKSDNVLMNNVKSLVSTREQQSIV